MDRHTRNSTCPDSTFLLNVLLFIVDRFLMLKFKHRAYMLCIIVNRATRVSTLYLFNNLSSWVEFLLTKLNIHWIRSTADLQSPTAERQPTRTVTMSCRHFSNCNYNICKSLTVTVTGSLSTFYFIRLIYYGSDTERLNLNLPITFCMYF